MIRYVTELEGVGPGELGGFFVGWPSPPSPERHLDILKGSHLFVLALDDATGRVVGFVNVISDGVLSAYLPLLEVLPAYQGRGIGRELVERVIALCDELYMLDLTCDPDLVVFYEHLGFTRVTAMARRNYTRQSAAN